MALLSSPTPRRRSGSNHLGMLDIRRLVRTEQLPYFVP